MLTIPFYAKRLMLLTVLYGVILFLWLAPEDNNPWIVTILGFGIALLITARLMLRVAGRTLTPRVWMPGLVVLGAGIGAVTTLSTIALMFLKSAMHNHIYPDYPPLMMFGILQRLPAWILAGALIGLSAALILYEQVRKRVTRHVKSS